MDKSKSPKVFSPYKKFHGIFIPNWLLPLEECSNEAKILYGILSRYAGKDTYCYPGQEDLAEEMKRSVRSVKRYTEELQGLHLIQVKRVGQGKNNLYSFLFNKKYISDKDFRSDTRGSSNMTEKTAPVSTPKPKQELPAPSDKKRTAVSTPINKDIKESVSNKSKSNKNHLITTSSDASVNMDEDEKVAEVAKCWNSFFQGKIKRSDKKLIKKIKKALHNYSVSQLKQAMYNRSISKYYTEQYPQHRDNPEKFFSYPETIKADLSRLPYILIDYDKKVELEGANQRRLESGGKSVLKIEIDPIKKDAKGRSMWRYYK